MSVLRNLEAKLEGLFEGAFSRAFKSRVQPVEIARKLVKEMEDNKTLSISHTYVPNNYMVYLSPQDREQFEGYEEGLKKELSDYLLEHARTEGLALVTRPTVDFNTDERLGEKGGGFVAGPGPPTGWRGTGPGFPEARLTRGEEFVPGFERFTFEVKYLFYVDEPLAAALKFGFLAVLYLFLLWVARSASRDLAGPVDPALVDDTSSGPARGRRNEGPAGNPRIEVVAALGHEPGTAFPIDGGVTLG